MPTTRPRAALLAALLAAFLAAAPHAVKADEPPRHHRADGFQNNYVEFEPKGLGALLKWKLESSREGLPKPPATPTPRATPDLDFIRDNARAGASMQPTVTWIGHASALVQLGGLNLLTDPIFSERASPLGFVGPKRAQPPGIALADLPHIDVVLISHNHYDHLDDASVRALNVQAGGPPLFIVPLGVKTWMADRDITNAIELDWWQSHAVGMTEIVMTPVQHWSGRGLNDRLKTLWGGYAVFAPDLHLFFTGDTGYSKDFVDIREHFRSREADGGGFDLALIAIGAYEPRWFMTSQHVNPTEAVQIHVDVNSKRSIGIHWGTFELTDESLDQPPKDLADARRAKGLADDAFTVMAVGETRRIARRAP